MYSCRRFLRGCPSISSLPKQKTSWGVWVHLFWLHLTCEISTLLLLNLLNPTKVPILFRLRMKSPFLAALSAPARLKMSLAIASGKSKSLSMLGMTLLVSNNVWFDANGSLHRHPFSLRALLASLASSSEAQSKASSGTKSWRQQGLLLTSYLPLTSLTGDMVLLNMKVRSRTCTRWWTLLGMGLL